jgi:stage IV sporulation protein FB
MLFFQEPSPTHYDLRFSIAGIPVRVHPAFWLITLLFGSASGNLASLLVWIPAVFVSILVHELGHAFAMRRYGRPAHIVLYFGGGLTIPEAVSWGYRQQTDIALTINQEIAVSLAGPAAGFLMAGLVLASVAVAGGSVGITFLFGLLPYPLAQLPASGWLIGLIVGSLLWVNIFWGLINLMPVYPLDGGQVARYVWLKRNPWDGVRRSLWLSVIVGAVAALVGLALLNSLYVALLFGLLAFQSYQSLQGRPGV